MRPAYAVWRKRTLNSDERCHGATRQVPQRAGGVRANPRVQQVSQVGGCVHITRQAKIADQARQRARCTCGAEVPIHAGWPKRGANHVRRPQQERVGSLTVVARAYHDGARRRARRAHDRRKVTRADRRDVARQDDHGGGAPLLRRGHPGANRGVHIAEAGVANNHAGTASEIAGSVVRDEHRSVDKAARPTADVQHVGKHGPREQRAFRLAEDTPEPGFGGGAGARDDDGPDSIDHRCSVYATGFW